MRCRRRSGKGPACSLRVSSRYAPKTDSCGGDLPDGRISEVMKVIKNSDVEAYYFICFFWEGVISKGYLRYLQVFVIG